MLKDSREICFLEVRSVEMEEKMNPYPILTLGIITVSFAAIFIRFSTAPPLIIAFYRLFYAVIILLPLTLFKYREEWLQRDTNSILLSLLAGFFLALHFFFWITSLEYTTVNSSVILVATHPILVALLAALLFKEEISIKILLGVLMAIVGSIIIGVGGFRVDMGIWKGDLLAILGSVMMAGYILVGSRVRKVLPLLMYVLLTYSMASILLLFFTLFSRLPLGGYSSYNHLLFFLLALGPTVIGHTCFNWALKYIPSTQVSVSILGEPIGATILAFYFFREVPSPLAFGGGILVLLGIYTTVRG